MSIGNQSEGILKIILKKSWSFEGASPWQSRPTYLILVLPGANAFSKAVDALRFTTGCCDTPGITEGRSFYDTYGLCNIPSSIAIAMVNP